MNNKPVAFIKYLFFGLLLLTLFHFESLAIGSLKISHLWKGIALLMLIVGLTFQRNISIFVYKPYFLIVFLNLLNLELFQNPMNASTMFLMALLVPIFGIYILKYHFHTIRKMLFFFIIFFVFSFVFYDLGLLKSYSGGYDLSSYGSDVTGLVGPFQNVHGASVALAGSFIVLFYFLFNKQFNSSLLLLVLALCLYFLIKTYVRTGLVMVFFGILPIVLYYFKNNIVSRVRIFLTIGLFTIILGSWIANNEIFLNRLTGTGSRYQERSFDNLGSGRGLLYKIHWNIFLENSFLEKAFGIGPTELMDRTQKITGNRLLSHNGFLQILLTHGILGFALLVSFFRKVYLLRKRISPENMVLINSLLIASLLMTFFQNFDVMYFNIIFFVAMTFMYKKMQISRV